MALSLKRKEGLRKGLNRVSEKRLQDILKATGHKELTAEQVHEVRKGIKSLRAILRLARAALSVEERKARNQALRDLAGRFSGPRDAAVLLSSFKGTYRESLKADGHSEIQPGWASQVQKSLTSQADKVIAAETYQDAAEAVRCLKGQMLPFQNSRGKEKPPEPGSKEDWEETIREGLRKTYCRGSPAHEADWGIPEPSDGEWHELRKRTKDLGYQLALLKKLKGIKSLLATLEELGKTLGDARDLSLLRGYLDKVKHERELPLAQQRSFHRLLTYIDERFRDLHEYALKVAQRAYRPGKKRFLRSMEKRWLR